MESFRVMLVDDEVLAIRHIKSLVDWSSLGFRVVAEAITAGQALEMADSADPDLIFMDIRMPAMDGLEVSRRIIGGGRKRIIYLLTSHQDFGCAKEALRLGIGGYLLKHDMNAQTLEEELSGIRTRLEEERKEQRILIRESLKELVLTGSLSSRAPHGFEAGRLLKGGIIMFYVQVDRAFPVLGNRIQPSRPILTVREGFEPDEECTDLTYIETVEIAPDRQVAFFAYSGLSGENARQRQAHRIASLLQAKACVERATASVLISRPCRRPDELAEGFRQLEKTSSSLTGFGRKRIMNQDAASPAEIEVEFEWNRLLLIIRDKSGDPQDISLRARIASVFDELSQGKSYPLLLGRVCEAFVLMLERLREANGMPAYSVGAQDRRNDEDRWYSLSGIRDWLMDEAEAVEARAGHMLPYSSKIRKIMLLIDSRYSEELTAESIGKDLSLSGDHVRHLFKEEVGRTLADYITGCRMEKAKALLRRDDYKVYEIAALVGYRSSQYFSNAFKKHTGQTPQEFKGEARQPS